MKLFEQEWKQPKPNPHELDKLKTPIEMGKNQYNYPIQPGRNVPLADVFSRQEINRLDQLRKELQQGRREAPNATQTPYVSRQSR
jgi:hypothetical protein